MRRRAAPTAPRATDRAPCGTDRPVPRRDPPAVRPESARGPGCNPWLRGIRSCQHSGMDVTPIDAAAPPLVAADARRTVALVVGALATVAFVALRLAVALNGHTALDVDVWWDAAMAGIAVL